MKILGIIPARGGSKGVPNKNIKLLGGKPLIAYTIESALACPLIHDIIVSTDSDKIKEIALQFGAQVPFIRPEVLASDESKSIDVVLHTLEFMQEKGKIYDAVVLLQPTNPFRAKGFIDDAIRTYQDQNLDSLISVLSVPIEFNPHWVFEQNSDGFLSLATGEMTIISRRQDLPNAFVRDGSVYITATDIILQNQSFYGERLGFIKAIPERHVNIDSQEDWERAEKLHQLLY